MRKLPKTLVDKIVDNTWYDTRKYSYLFENFIIKRIKIVDLNTTGVFDENHCDIYDMWGNPIDRKLVELSYNGWVPDTTLEKVYPNGEYKRANK